MRDRAAITLDLEIYRANGYYLYMTENRVARYYSRFGSWAGYNLVLGRSQHAGYWDSNTKSEKQAQANFLVEFAKLLNLKSGDKVLDAGSGQGVMARFLAKEYGAEVTGITITPREVKISEKLSRGMANQPRFVLGDYSNSEFADEYFDVIYVNETLSHAQNIKQTMKEFYRILKPGGRVVFADYEVNVRDMNDDQLRVIDFLEKYAGAFGIRQQGPGNIYKNLNYAGFDDISEIDWTDKTMPTYDRLRMIARPLVWIKPSSFLSRYFVNAVMASHGYSPLREAGLFRYLIYQARKRK